MKLSLDHVSTHWRLTVTAESPIAVLACNGKGDALVHQHWATPRHAMEAIDAAMARVVTQLAAEGIKARQRSVVTPLRLVAVHA